MTYVEPEALTAAVRNVVMQLYPAQAIRNFKTMEQRIYDRTAPKRIMTVMKGVFAGIALLLAAMGIYAVMAYAVSQRTHENRIKFLQVQRCSRCLATIHSPFMP